eukprot:TRINITY_DN111883_c0_g1_i1.p1 TRINITY_DN111883_c0_g1~~TRINITY_DN111883_c0_g1_i1.p1  ORF type:complete len:315 (+),score=50.71 TRINITY_DN111883_c0_g1_i1:76-1020(+)
MLAVVDDEGKVAVLYAANGDVRWEYVLSGRALACSFSPDTALLAAGGYDNMLTLFDTKSGALLQQIDHGIVKSLSFSPDSLQLAIGTKSGSVDVLDAKALASGHCKATCSKWSFASEGSVKAVQFSPDGLSLAACGVDCRVSLLSTSTENAGQVLWQWQGDNKVRALCFSPNGFVLAVGDDNGRVALVDATTGEVGETFSVGLFVFYLCFTPDGASIAVVEGEYHQKKVLMLDAESGVSQEVVKGNEEEHRCAGLAAACMSPDGQLIATGGRDDDCRIELISEASGNGLWHVTWHDFVHALCFSDSKVELSAQE